MTVASSKSLSPMLAAVLTGLLVGMPAGYMASAIVGPPPPPGPARQARTHDMGATNAQPGEGPATADFRRAEERMHAGMTTRHTGDADIDFVQGMLPHHQGAVDMAQIELEHGRDPAMRDLARRVVRTQTSEISLMRSWMAARAAN